MAQQHRAREEDIKIVLGLEAEPHQGTTHYWGLPYQLVTSGAHSNKQTNKETLVENQLSKPERAAMLKNLDTLEVTLLNVQAKINDARLLNQYLQRNLILHYHFE